MYHRFQKSYFLGFDVSVKGRLCCSQDILISAQYRIAFNYCFGIALPSRLRLGRELASKSLASSGKETIRNTSQSDRCDIRSDQYNALYAFCLGDTKSLQNSLTASSQQPQSSIVLMGILVTAVRPDQFSLVTYFWNFYASVFPGQIGCTKFSPLQRQCKINEVSAEALASQLSASSGRHQILQRRRDIRGDTATRSVEVLYL